MADREEKLTVLTMIVMAPTLNTFQGRILSLPTERHYRIKTPEFCSNKVGPTNIAFIKVHKSGSTTVSNLLARYALNHDLNIALPETKPVGFVFHCFGPFSEGKVLPLAEGQQYHTLFNHMIYNRTALDKVMPQNTFYLGIMRQPVDRFLSGVYYFKFLRPPGQNNTDNIRFAQFLSEKNKAKLQETSSVFNSLLWETGMPLKLQSNETEVKKHLEKLDRELDLMMVLEHFLESLVLLKRRACLDLKDIIFMKINCRIDYTMHNITDSDYARLRSWQIGDHIAYDHFYSKFWDQVRQEGESFYLEVANFRNLTSKVKDYCTDNISQWDTLLIPRSQWSEEFTVNSRDCELMLMEETKFQRLLLNRAQERRTKAGYRERRQKIPKWNPTC